MMQMMERPAEAGPDGLFHAAYDAGMRQLGAGGLEVSSIGHAELMEINRAYLDRWYALRGEHYEHDGFEGFVVRNKDGGVAAVIGHRPVDLGDGTLADAIRNLSFAYPAGVPEGAPDSFDDIPEIAEGIRGTARLVGGLWIDPKAAVKAGLGGSVLLSIVTRLKMVQVLAGQNPDHVLCFVIDRILAGREKGRSALDKYGFQNVVPGPVWVNHYPGEAEPDLPLNMAWISNADYRRVLAETPWVAAEMERRLAA